MNQLEINVTEYSRGSYKDENHIRANFNEETKMWAIYSTMGPTWIYNFVKGEWMLPYGIPSRLPSDFCVDYDGMMNAMKTVPSKKVQFRRTRCSFEGIFA